MPIPKSFEAFRQLFEDVGDPPMPDPDDVETEEEKPEQSEEEEKIEELLSIACDAILADLHSNEMLRDAVISSVPNLKNHTILFVINPTLQATSDLIDFLSDHPRIRKYALGARKLDDGERVRAVKILPVPVEDECDPPDARDRKDKEKEQDDLQQGGRETDSGALNSTMFNQAPGL